MTRLAARRTHFDRSPVVVNVDIEADGLAGEEAVVEVIESGQVIQSQRIAVAGPEQVSQVRLEFVPAKPGWLEYEARVRMSFTGPLDSPAAVDIRAGKRPVDAKQRARFLIDNTPRNGSCMPARGPIGNTSSFAGPCKRMNSCSSPA